MRRAASSARSSASSRESPVGEHRARAVGAPAERAEDVPGLAVDPHVLHSLHRSRLLRPLDLLEHALGRDEEAHHGAADLRHGVQRGRPDRLAERGLEREALRSTPSASFAELGVVPAAEAGGDLDHLRPVGADPQLRVGRAVLDPERRHCGSATSAACPPASLGHT